METGSVPIFTTGLYTVILAPVPNLHLHLHLKHQEAMQRKASWNQLPPIQKGERRE